MGEMVDLAVLKKNPPKPINILCLSLLYSHSFVCKGI